MAVFAACGGGEGGGGTTGSPVGATTSDRAEVRAAFERLARAFRAANGSAFCALLTESERKQVAQFGHAAGFGEWCPGVIAEAAGSARGHWGTGSKRLGIEVDGRRATVVVREAGNPARELRFVRQDGNWKLSESGFNADPLAVVPGGDDFDPRP
ncbi:MAG: hypothetical protein GXY03_13920 [Solirubrobacterales bacterium]|nr:hypothetical protein [Solirubrobacterales bacterium]